MADNQPFKKCSNCSFKTKLFCDGNYDDRFCLDWLPQKASCLYCLRLKRCIQDAVKVSTGRVCDQFARNKYPPKSIQEAQRELESLLVDKDDGDEADELFSPVRLVEDIINSDFNPKIFDTIDDSDFPKPDNEIDFILDPEFMGITLFPRQLVVALNFFGCYCPYCSDTVYINSKVKVDTHIDDILDRTVLYNSVGVCPKCRRTKYDAYADKKLKLYNQLIGAVGQRGGKSLMSAIFSAVITMKYLTLPQPSNFFPGVLKNTTLHGTFVSITYGQAFDTVWQPYYELIIGTKWFKDYVRFLEDEGNRVGRELVKIRDTFVIFSNKNITLYPSGPDKRKLRGRTRFLSCIDEVGWFFGSEDAVKYNPDEIYEALDNSLMTILSGSKRIFQKFPYTPTAYGLYISSPSSKTDKSMRMYQQSKSSETIYGFHYPTWDFNPNIKKSDLAEKYRNDPVAAERDFGANPPHSSSPFISSPAAIIPCFTKKLNPIKLRYGKVIRDSLGGKLISPYVNIKRAKTTPSVLGIDCGYNNNSFACVVQSFHPDYENTIEVSGVIEMVPEKYPLSFPDIYENVISKIITQFNVKLVVFDRWQSIDLSQRVFRDHNVDAIMYTLNYIGFDEVRTRLLSNDYIFPKTERDINDLVNMQKSVDELIRDAPISHLFLQMLMVHDTGKTVTKGDNISDDIFRALCIGSVVMTDPEYEDLFVGGGLESGVTNINNMCVVINKSNYGGSPGMGDIQNSGIGVAVGGSMTAVNNQSSSFRR